MSKNSVETAALPACRGPWRTAGRNWQTHQLEGLALARACGFESPLPHQQLTSIFDVRSWSCGQVFGQVHKGGKANRPGAPLGFLVTTVKIRLAVEINRSWPTTAVVDAQGVRRDGEAASGADPNLNTLVTL